MRIYLLCLTAFLALVVALPAQQTYYVNHNVTGGQQNGTDWSNAFGDLQAALATAQYGDEIWVAAGVYIPTSTTNRNIAFELKNGVKLLGGFQGTETSAGQRDPDVYPTRLSGNIGDPGLDNDNAYHVLRGRGLDETTQIDGFIISNGYSPGADGQHSDPYGAGLFLVGSAALENSRPLISHCRFEFNHAGEAGGAIAALYQDPDDAFLTPHLINPVLHDCVFDQNQSNTRAGALMKDGPSGSTDTFSLENCIFTRNRAYLLDGGGIYFSNPLNSSIALHHCRFEENTTVGGAGGGFSMPVFPPGGYTVNLLLDSCIFRKNVGTEGGGFVIDGRTSPQPDVAINLKILSCLFEENRAKNEEGSAYFVTLGQNDHINAELRNSQFIKNIVNSYFATSFICYEESEANILVDGCSFIGNRNEVAGDYCAGYDASGHKITSILNNCLFAYNGAAVFAGGNENTQVLTQITNCTFFRNGTQPFGKRWYFSYNQPGSVYYNKMNFRNCIIWEPCNPAYLFNNNNPDVMNNSWFNLDYCAFSPLILAQIGNYQEILGDSIYVGDYPDFVDTLAWDFRLKQCSPLLNRGDNQAAQNAGLLLDADHLPRIRFGVVDLGAYETQDSCITIGSSEPMVPMALQLSPNPARTGELLALAFHPEGSSYSISDALGRILKAGLLPESGRLELTAPDLTGVYMLHIYTRGKPFSKKFVVVE